jgi:hypothetical protein
MRLTRLVLAFCITVAASAQTAPTIKPIAGETRQFQAVRAAKSPMIDGDLSDEAWQNAPELVGFTQREPNEGKPAVQQTRVKIVYDDEAIYFGAFMEDSGPVTPLLARRDTDFSNGDYIKFVVDSQHDRQNGAAFIVNASNVQADSILYNDVADDSSWDGVWSSATKIVDKGWIAEVRVPFSQLRFPDRETHTWGFNTTRWNARLHEMSRLVFTPRTETGYVSRFGDLHGLTGVHPKRALELVPYGVARSDLRSRADNPFVQPSAHRADAGLDVKYGLTSNLTLTGTINPDFGQVEVDPAVLNLSQFETFFPEKRPFFTEGASVFRFGNSPAQSRFGFNVWFPTFFYSRRIGRTPQGDIEDVDYVDPPAETTILGAAKVTGKVGKGWSVGLLDALTDREQAWFSVGPLAGKRTVEPMTNYLVGRATKDYGKDSRAGFLFTSVNRRLSENLEPQLRESAYFAGVDGYTRFADKSWLVDWYAGSSLIDGSTEAIELAQNSSARYYGRPDASHIELDPTRTSLTGWAARTMLAKQKGKWRPNFQVQALSPGFEVNDVGFLPRTDAISTHALVQYINTDPTKYTREISGWVAKYQNWNFDRDLTANGASSELFLQFKNYWYGIVGLSGGARRADDRITRGGPLMQLPADRFVSATIGSDSRKKYYFEAWTESGTDEADGQFNYYGGTFTYRPTSAIRLSLSPRYSRVHENIQYVTQVDDAAYKATYGKRFLFATLDQRTIDIGVRTEWTVSSRLSFQMYLQPFVSSGDYSGFKYLAQPRTFDFTRIDDAQADAEAGNPDFNFRSVRGSAVVRWEFRPGSAMYLVWNENREESIDRGDFRLRRDFGALPNAPSQDVFLVKFSYWLPM